MLLDRKTRILIFLIFILSSCEPVYHVKINNQTDKDIVLEITFDKQTLEKAWQGEPYIPFLKTFGTNSAGTTLTSADSINLINVYSIAPNTTFVLESGVEHYTNYDLYKRLRIISKDTLTMNGRVEIAKSFIQTNVRTWELNIK